MLDEKDLKAIADMMNVIIENKVQTQLNLIVENQQIMMEKLDSKVDREEFEDRVSTLEGVVRSHSRDITELKKAN